MIRVYCKDCKYLIFNAVNPSASDCRHPDILPEPGATRTWYSEHKFKTYGDPKELNKNNDCPHYYHEEKHES